MRIFHFSAQTPRSFTGRDRRVSEGIFPRRPRPTTNESNGAPVRRLSENKTPAARETFGISACSTCQAGKISGEALPDRRELAVESFLAGLSAGRREDSDSGMNGMLPPNFPQAGNGLQLPPHGGTGETGRTTRPPARWRDPGPQGCGSCRQSATVIDAPRHFRRTAVARTDHLKLAAVTASRF